MIIRELQDEILRLKKENDIAVLAHSYQSPEILEIADITGDSFALSVAAQKLPQKSALMCGVRFMAESLKMLSPEKHVILSHAEATCPMAEQILPERVRTFKKEHPEYAVVAYINTTAALKAECDVCVTSSSAVKIVSALPERDILFIPDQNLGSYVQKSLPEKNILLWDGFCPVHNALTAEDCAAAKTAHPGAKLLLHPEAPAGALAYADLAGSTAEILKYALSTEEECIIGTEKSIADFLKIKTGQNRFHVLSKKLICPDMRLTTLPDVLACLKGEGGEVIDMDAGLIERARRPVDAMIRLGS